LLKEEKSVPLILSIFVSKYVFKRKGFRVKEFISMKLLSRQNNGFDFVNFR
jgi:hypothetical protein